MSPSCNSNAARTAARLCSLSWKTDGGPTPGITFSSNSRRTSSHNALMHPFSTFSLLVHLRQFAVARPCIYPGRPSCGVGGAGLLGPGVCGLGGADTLNIGCSLWQDCPCIVPPLVSSTYFPC